MDVHKIAPDFSVSPQCTPHDLSLVRAQGFCAIMINRPDGEADDQPPAGQIEEAARAHGLEVRYLPIVPGQITDENVAEFAQSLQALPAPVLAFCRTGTRSASLWALSQAGHLSTEAILQTTKEAGYDLSGLTARLEARAQAKPGAVPTPGGKIHDVVIIGGGAAGISVASSLLKRRPDLDIVIVEPKTEHYYQPGWTLVGGGVFDRNQTKRTMMSVMPQGVYWAKAACAAFEPEHNEVVLEGGERIRYTTLVVAPGLKLDWDKVEGLRETLGRNGVTSNYLFDMAPYTWELVQSLKSGRAIFTQPPMPIKCAGAPQKAMYLACDAWRRAGTLTNIEVEFHNAGAVLFGVADYVPALMAYIEKYNAKLCFNENLVGVDGASKTAYFNVTQADGTSVREAREFDMIHVCPPQGPIDFVKTSPLANEAGWVDVDGETLQHTKFGNVFGLGDGGSTPNAKTAAAVRKQAPVVAHNVLRFLDGKAPNAVYNGYGSCPLTVERGKIVLAEFAYGGKLDPSFPTWLIDGTKPTRLAWFLKEKMLPSIYFNQMLKGVEWLAEPTLLTHTPKPHEAQQACDFKDAPKP
ncbi:bifunctional protein tyrosine phosphatase family protein/NAD(P)/FAD-dependent oxidoreductase [Woodsholea maritima]|uniref:bifunctional protein tyrosine phosphatase family protein/NAD(P)/FAD-dependent oxidoreductase n=1 Tax=Woodsholea maritima TaxID=240237 RepID=UPI0003785124|nr:bifunctional protein tyrosine phosphatase family protein/NAD(P)/FAD-dependent oxidoreductase [Woodsholea maritima]